jgi:hypothetical protein
VGRKVDGQAPVPCLFSDVLAKSIGYVSDSDRLQKYATGVDLEQIRSSESHSAKAAHQKIVAFPHQLELGKIIPHTNVVIV